MCRHCPIPSVYDGRIRIVQAQTVLDDIAQRVGWLHDHETQNPDGQPADGAWRHSWQKHENETYDAATDVRGASPWMSENIIDGLWHAWLATSDPRIPPMLTAFGRYLEKFGWIDPKLLTGRGQESKITATKTQISNIKAALDMFEHDNSRFPTNDEGLNALVNPPSGLPNWHKYMDQLPLDGFQNPFVYRIPGTNGRDYDLVSYGPDGHEGGGDDITN